MVARSRELVKCTHPGCTYQCQRRMMKRHTESKHRVATKKSERNASNFASESIRQILSRESSSADFDIAPEVLVTSVNPSMVHPYPPENSSNPRITNIERQIATLRGELLNKIDQLQAQEIAETQRSLTFDDDTSPNGPRVRSLLMMRDESNGLLEICPEEGMIFCKACKENSVGSAGAFPYNFALGVSFDKDANLPSEFTSLKYKIKRHMRSPRHLNNVKKMKPIENDSDEDITGKIAKRVLRTAYHVIRSFYPQKEFSNLINLQNWNGLDVGETNHSATLLVKLRDAFYEELVLRMKEFCEDAPCVAIVADKVTLKRRTLDVIAFHSVVPHAKAGNLVQCIVVGSPEVASHDGDAQAESWLAVLANIGITRPEQLAAIGLDEQYQDNSVTQKVVSLLNENPYEEVCVPTVWNQGHQLELAIGQAKKVDWVAQMINIITSVTKIFKGTKSFAEISAGKNLRQPAIFSETQWSTSAANVIDIFSHNTPFYKMQIELERNRGNFARGNWRSDENVKYFLTYTADVTLRAAGLCDIFTVAGKCSRTLQNLQKLPWEKMEELTNLSNIFNDMCSTLKLQAGRCAGQYSEEFLEALDENLAKYWPNLRQCHQLSNQQFSAYRQVNDIALLLDLLCEQCRLRTTNDLLIETAFDLRRVADLTYARAARSISSQSKMMLESFMVLKQKNLIPAHLDVTEPCYQKVCQILQEYKTDTPAIDNQELFKYLWTKSADDIFLRNYMHIVVRLWLIYPCESFVDSVATVLRDVFGEHRNLPYANAAKEFIIRWNGPPLGQADPLLEAVDKRLKMKFTKKPNRFKHPAGSMLSRYKEESFPLQGLYPTGDENQELM